MMTKTLDEKSVENYPDLFVATDCYLCGAVAAKPVGYNISNDIACDACDSYAEAVYASQGGQ